MEKQLLYVYIDNFYGFQKQGFNFSTKEKFCVYGTETLILQKQDMEKSFVEEFWGKSILNINMLIGDNGSGKTTLMKIIIEWICCLSQGNLPQEKGILVFGQNDKIGYIAFEKGDKLDLSADIPEAEEYSISQVVEFTRGLQLLYFSNTMTDLNLSNDILSDCSLYQRIIKANEDSKLSGKNIIENYNLMEFRNQVDIALNRNVEDFPVYNLRMEVRHLEFADIIQGQRGQNITGDLIRLWEHYFGSGQDNNVSDGEQLVIELLKTLLIGTIKHVLQCRKNEEKPIAKSGEMIECYNRICTEGKIEEGIECIKHFFKDLILDNISNIGRGKKINDILRFVNLLQSGVRNADDWLSGMGEFSSDRKGNIVVRIDIGSDNREKFKSFWEAYKGVMIYMETVSFSWIASSGERNWVSLFSVLTSVSGENFWLFLDEPDNTLHPDWQRTLLDKIIEACNGGNYKGKKVQIWISTHSPIMLSDMPGNSVTYLDNKTNMGRQIEETFGQNIYALFNHAFVLHDGVIGTFASKKIEEVMDRLQNIERGLLERENASHNSDEISSDLEYCETIAELLAEPLFKRYFMDSIAKMKELQNRKRVQQE